MENSGWVRGPAKSTWIQLMIKTKGVPGIWVFGFVFFFVLCSMIPSTAFPGPCSDLSPLSSPRELACPTDSPASLQILSGSSLLERTPLLSRVWEVPFLLEDKRVWGVDEIQGSLLSSLIFLFREIWLHVCSVLVHQPCVLITHKTGKYEKKKYFY